MWLGPANATLDDRFDLKADDDPRTNVTRKRQIDIQPRAHVLHGVYTPRALYPAPRNRKR